MGITTGWLLLNFFLLTLFVNVLHCHRPQQSRPSVRQRCHESESVHMTQQKYSAALGTSTQPSLLLSHPADTE